MHQRCWLISSLVVTLSGCAWVTLSSDGAKVRVFADAEVTNCKRVGETDVSLKDKIAGINRSQDKVKAELETLGRNSAAGMGGDTIVAAGATNDGTQSFLVYQCIGVAQ